MSSRFISETRPKARKDHPCIWCRDDIKTGETHVRTVITYDGELQSDRFHPECYEAAQTFFETETEFEPHSFQRGSLFGA